MSYSGKLRSVKLGSVVKKSGLLIMTDVVMLAKEGIYSKLHGVCVLLERWGRLFEVR